jgi:hypothetical protein
MTTPAIEFTDVLSLLAKLTEEELEQLILVGGQALAFWADYYDFKEEEHGVSLMSKDIDFLGGTEVAEHCAKLWQGQLYKPVPFEPTPNNAKVVVPLGNGETLTIDFLAGVYGITDQAVYQRKAQIETKEGIRFYVMTPLFCLKSRLENVLGLGYGGPRIWQEVRKLQVAIHIQQRHLVSLFEFGQKRVALKETQLLLHWARQDTGIRIFTDYEIDLLEALPKSHSGYGEPFWQLDYPAKESRILEKRQRFLQFRRRREELTKSIEPETKFCPKP